MSTLLQISGGHGGVLAGAADEITVRAEWRDKLPISCWRFWQTLSLL